MQLDLLIENQCLSYQTVSHFPFIALYSDLWWARSLSHDFKIWPITFQDSGPSEPILCEKISKLHKTESTCRLSIQ